jgi:predicted nucleic acid-binding protein
MNLFWDTSALVALLFEEPRSEEAALASAATTSGHAWRWIRVEAAAALARRGASEERWKRMEDLLAGLRFTDLAPADLDAVCRANRQWRLRAADAGHFHCFRRAAYAMPDLQLVSFDDEMLAVARASGVQIWQPPGAAGVRPSLIREAGAANGPVRRRRRQTKANLKPGT